MRSARGSTKGSVSSRRVTDEIKPEKMKLVSVSPFRAVVKVQPEDGDDSLDEEPE